MARCHMATDKESGTKYWLPGCMGGAVYGDLDYCTCWGTPERITRAEKLLDQIEEVAVKRQEMGLIDAARELRTEWMRLKTAIS